MLKFAPPALVRRALASDLVDRLTAPHGIDRYLELVHPTWTVREVRAEVVHARRQTPGTVTLVLRPNDAWSGFVAGQHVVVAQQVDGAGFAVGTLFHLRGCNVSGPEVGHGGGHVHPQHIGQPRH